MAKATNSSERVLVEGRCLLVLQGGTLEAPVESFACFSRPAKAAKEKLVVTEDR